jgi:hypothetical protein
MVSAAEFARLSCGAFFLVGLVTGVWKYRKMATSADATAPAYVDICHRAALMYAFACLVLAEFAGTSAWFDAVNLVATSLPILFFALAVLSYAVHGLLQDTDNQIRQPHKLGERAVHPRLVSQFIYVLSAAEIGGFLVLLAGHFAGANLAH